MTILKHIAPAVVVIGLCSAADFSYTDKTEITGGTVKNMMGMAARMGGAPQGPTQTTHYFHDNRMARKGDRSTTVYDVDHDTITQIDFNKKEYSTITFAEFAELGKQLAAKMSAMRGQKDVPELNWTVNVDKTGATKQVAGVKTEQAIFKMEVAATDKQSGSVGVTRMNFEHWIGKIPGYETVKAFQMRMAKKMSADAGANPMLGMQAGPGAAKGMAEAAKALGEIEGMPLATVSKMYGTGGMGMGGMPPPQSGQQTSSQDSGQKAKDAAIADAIGGRLGRFGGLGGRLGKKNQDQAPQQQPATAAPQTGAPAAQGGSDLFMESNTEVISFSSAPFDYSVFEVPAGFKQVEHPMKRMGNRQ